MSLELSTPEQEEVIRMAAEHKVREELEEAMRTSTVTSSVSNTAPTISVSGSGEA